MSLETVTAACGHSYEKRLYGPAPSRAAECLRLSTMFCPGCYRRRAEAEIQSTARTLLPLSLPRLYGSRSQVEWAESLRTQVFAALEQIAAAQPREGRPDDAPLARATIERLERQQAASFWLDRRWLTARDWLRLTILDLAGCSGNWQDFNLRERGRLAATARARCRAA